ncbi:MAG: hypothetical protein PVJ04_17205, partial [Gemmatimonadota bacterium]
MSAPSTVRAAAGCLLLGLSVVLHQGCGTSGQPFANKRPTASLTSGPVEGGTVSYSIDIAWEGSDPDGFIERFEYAVDPPPEFTEEEISEGGQGIVEEVIPGTGDAPTVTRVRKTVAGETVSFDWVHTDASSHHFLFSTPDPEGDPAPPDSEARFFGMHAVYVRSVDDRGGTSVPDHVAFTAVNVAPESQITRPVISQEILNTGLEVTFEWTGLDPDSPHPGREPDHYLFKAARLDTMDPPCPLVICPPEKALGSFDTWDVLPPGLDAMEVSLDPGQYFVGIAAVDENGTVEPFLDVGRNVAKIQAFVSGGHPELTLNCTAGIFTTTLLGTFSAEFPAGAYLQSTLACDASVYGESCDGFRWGVDIPDLEGPEGWSAWFPGPVIGPIIFQQPGIHTLTVQARDTRGSVTTLILSLDIVEFTFDRDVLLVDDSFDTVYPNDAEHDAFWRQRLLNYRVGLVYEFACFGDNDRTFLSPAIPTLKELGMYRLLIWVTFGSGYNGESGLLRAASLTRTLRSYLAAGGQLWVVGRLTVPPMLDSPNGVRADFNYPIDEERIYPGTFAWDIMKLRTTRINNPKGNSDQRDFLWGVGPFPGGPAPYDSMTVDVTKLRLPYQLAVTSCDAVFDPIFAESDPAFRGDIDSLFAYRAYGPEQQGYPSVYHNRLTAIRWHDPDPAREHGRVQWFGFDLYFMNDDEAQ